MTPQQIQQKLTKGDQVLFKNGLTLYYVGPYLGDNTKGWFKENNGSTNQPKYLRNIVKIQGRPIKEQKMGIQEEIKEELKKILKEQKEETLTFEKDPLEYIIQRYPSLDATLIDLMTESYKEYLTGIYVMSPKPTTFKILLHNGQSFYLTYTPKAYIAKVAGKSYHLMSLKDEEYAIKAISRLLMMGVPPAAQGPGEEQDGEMDSKDAFAADMTSEPDLTAGLDDLETPGEEPEGEAAPEGEEELQEQEEPKKKIPTRFRIVKNKSIPKKHLVESKAYISGKGLDEYNFLNHIDTEVFLELANPDMSYEYKQTIPHYWEFTDKYGNNLGVKIIPGVNEVYSYYILYDKLGRKVEVYDYNGVKNGLDPNNPLILGSDDRRSDTICKIIRDEILPKYLLNKKPQLIRLNPLDNYRYKVFYKCAEVCKEKHPELELKKMDPYIMLINK